MARVHGLLVLMLRVITGCRNKLLFVRIKKKIFINLLKLDVIMIWY